MFFLSRVEVAFCTLPNKPLLHAHECTRAQHYCKHFVPKWSQNKQFQKKESCQGTRLGDRVENK